MKKLLLIAGLAAATLSFFGCNKQETDFAGNEGKISIRFTTPDTKTTNEGMSTLWAKGDALTVFYAPTGTTEYSANTKFSFADDEAAANGVATADVQLESGTYDWYALYPYSSKYSTPENTDTYATVGSSASGSQTQEGLNSTAHLAGYNYPLAGLGTFASTASPTIQMKQLSTVLAVKVKNTTSVPVKVNSVSVTAPVYLVGGYFVDFSKATPVMVPEEQGYNSKTAKLAVTGESTIDAGATATFYLAVCPFTLSSQDLTVKIIAEEGSVEKTKSVSATFAAGHIKTLNVDFDDASGPSEIITATVEEFLAASVSEDQWYQLTGTVSNIASTTYGNFDLTDETGTVYVYGLTATKVAKNDKTFGSLDIKEGDKVTIISLRSEHNGSPQAGGNTPAYFVSKEESTVPSFGVKKTAYEVPATATSIKIDVTGNVAWTADGSDGTTLDKTSGEGEGVITVSFPANTAAQPKEYTVFVRTEAEVDNDEIEVDITQAAAYDGVTISWTSGEDWTGVADGAEVITLTCGDYLVTIRKNNGSTAPTVNASSNDARAYAKATVTVKNTKGINMTKLVFNLSAAGLKRLAPITADKGEVAAQALGDATVTWTGEATEVTFTVGDKAVYGTDGDTKSGQLDFSSINVEEGGQGVVVTLSSIAVTGQKESFTVGDTFTFGGTVTATYSDGSTKDVTSSAEVSTPDLSSAGTKEVTVTYTEDGVTKTAKYNITVNAAPEHDGSLEKPYTVEEAMAATEALGLGKTSADSYYTKGIISEISEVSVGYGNATYFISDDGSTTTQFKVYHGKFIGNASFTAEDQIKVGDEVLVYGKLTYYKPNSGDPELEIASNNYIYSLTRNGSAVHALSATISGTSVGSNAATLTVNVYGDVAWTASATNGASVSPASGDGIGSVTVSIPANTTEQEKTYKVTVATTASVDNNPVEFTVSQAAQDNSNQWVATSLDQITATDVFVIVSTDASGNTYAMTNNNGTTAAPAAQAVTISGSILTGTPDDKLQWKLGGTAGAYVFYVAGDDSKWLYATNTNNGLRVGTNADNAFSIKDDYLYHNGQSRYVGVYNKQDWRCYTSINNNIKDQTFTFFVKKKK